VLFRSAAVIIHVSDISNPHHAEHDADVLKVLADLGVQDRPRLNVFNKTDRIPEEDLAVLKKSNERRDNAVFTSALTGAGLDALLSRVDAVMPVDPLVRLRLRIPISDGRHLSLVHACGRVIHSEVLDGHMDLDAELPESLARRLEDFVCPPARAVP
jgi:GTP-binding protein HflX